MADPEAIQPDPRLIDELADRLSDAVAERVVAALTDGSIQQPRTTMAWLDAEEVAQQLGVSRDSVYEIADRLGGSRIGSGARSPLPYPPRALDSRTRNVRSGIGSSATGTWTSEEVAGLWTARHVAAYYGVTLNFVYAHAEELGGIRLGAGPCARLRFDPQGVRERWSTVSQLPASRRRAQKGAGPRHSGRSGTHQRGYELLDFEREL